MKSARGAALGAVFLLCFVVPTPADEPEPLVTSLSRSDLLLYFARAERAGSVQGWLDVMDVPLAELPDWERSRFQAEYQARLADWLTRRWNEQLPAADLESFLKEIEASDRALLFQVDSSGALLRDDRGAALLRGSEGLETDRAAWREQAQGSMSVLVERWEHQATTVWHELLAVLPAELQTRLGGGAGISLARYTQEVRSEFARLLRQAESRFVAARLRDQVSLRARSEARSAAEIARGLIEGTQGDLDEARRLLGDPGISGAAQGGVAALAVDPRDWDAQFRRELERGIESWNQAESRLLEERLRWEAAARSSLLEAEQAWERAFGEMAAARRGWINEMQAAYEEGQARWEQAEASLSAQYLLCTEQLAAGSQRELARLEEQVRAAVGVYRSSAELAELAERSIRGLQTEIQRILGQRPEGAEGAQGPQQQEGLAGSLAELEAELAYWQGEDGRGGVLGQSLNACAAARQGLLDLEAAVRGYGADRLPRELDASVSLEQEVARLEADLAYLRRQAAIAQAVLDYAEGAAGGAGGGQARPSAAETEAACSEARSELEARHSAYLEAAQALQLFIEGESWDPSRYAVLQSELDSAASACREARYALQQAEEILDYAAASYALPELDPEAVLAERQAACRRTEQVLELLRSLGAGPEQLQFPERLDGAYGALKQTEAECLEALQHLELGRERMLLGLEVLEGEVAGALQELGRRAAEVFAFRREAAEEGEFEGLPFHPDSGVLASGASPLEALTEFSAEDEQALAVQVRDYFSGEAEAVARRLSTDAVAWLLALNRSGQPAAGTLRRLGLAYYYDAAVQGDLEIPGAPGVSVTILNNGSFRALIGDRFLNLGPQTVQVWNEQTESWEQQETYPEGKLTPEDYLAREARSACQQVLADPETRKLYGFFKAMFATGHFAPGAEFIGADLSDLAYHYVQGKAGKLQDHYEGLRKVLWLNLFLFLANEAKIQDIAGYRSQLGQVHVPEPVARGAILEATDQADQAGCDWREGGAELERLLGRGGPTVESFQAVLEQESGRPVNPQLAAALVETMGASAGCPLEDHFAVLAAAAETVGRRLAAARGELATRVAALGAEHAQRSRQYVECLYEALTAGGAPGAAGGGLGAGAGAPGLAELSAAARALFVNPSFSVSDYREHEVDTAGQIPAYTRIGEAVRLGELGAALLGLMHERVSLLQQQEQQELQLEIRQTYERRLAWERKAGALLGVGLREWQKASEGLEETRRRWYAECGEEYTARSQLWQAKHLLLQANRQQWLEESTATAVKTGAAALAREMGLSRQRLSAEVEDVTVPDLAVPAPDMDEVLRRVACGTELGELLGRARELGSRAGDLSSLLAASLPRLECAVTRSGSAGELAAKAGEEVQRRVALLTALQMRRTVEEAQEAIAENIEQANRSVERDLTGRLQAVGYSRSGEQYRRRAIIDQTLFGGTEWETQGVPAYSWFVAPEPDYGVDLRRESLEGRSGEAVQELILQARENLGRYLQLVFGRKPAEREAWNWEAISDDFRVRFDAQAAAFASSAGYDRLFQEGERAGRHMFHDTDGLFYFHIGYAPIMDEDSPEEVDQPGYGELGKIMEAYLRNEARLARGLAVLEVPWYSQRFWDDDADNDGEADVLGAPSMRTVVDLTVSIAATATGNVWAAAAINMIDDTVFAVADVAGGYLEADQAFFNLGRQAMIGFATAGVGQGFDALAAGSGAFGESVIGKTLLQGLESTASAAVSGSLGAIVLDASGRFSFDRDAFGEALVGEAALASYIGGMTGSFLEGNTAGFSAWDAAEVRAVSGLAGGLTQAALEYAWTGQTTLNLLNFNMVGWQTAGGRTLSGGLLELTLGGDGPLLSPGKGGVDVSATAVAAAVRGADTWWQNTRIQTYDLLGDTAYGEGYRGYRQAGTALRALYSFGDQRGAELYQQILAGQARLHVGLADPLTVGRTEMDAGLKQVYLASLGERWDRYSRLLGGVALQHEAWRDGYRAGMIRPNGSVVSLAENTAETALAVRGHTEMALRVAGDYGFGLFDQNRSLLRDLVALRLTELLESGAFDRYVEAAYDSEEDAYRIERWSGRAIGTPLRNSGYYFMMLDDEQSDAAKASLRSSTWPGVLLVDLIHNLFSDKDRIEMRQPLFNIVGNEDYFGALKVLYGKGADAFGVGTDVVGLIDDVVTAYEIARNVDIPAGKVVSGVSGALETIDQIIQGVGAGINAVIEKQFAEYWWRSGVPNFTQKKEDLEALTRFMFQQFVGGTRDDEVFEALRQFRRLHPDASIRNYLTYADWQLRLLSFGEQYTALPYRVPNGMATTDGRAQYTWTFEEWAAYEAICERIFGK